LAVFNQNEDIVTLLLQSGANINAISKQVSTNHFLIILVLLIPTQSNVTPLHIATLFGNTSIVKILLAYGADVNIMDEVSLKNSVFFLIMSTYRINFSQKDLRTPLYNAISASDELGQILLSAGSNVSCKDFVCEIQKFLLFFNLNFIILLFYYKVFIFM
jgi:ankyrin repeat protein